MQINLEAAEINAIQAYDSHNIQINSVLYQSSLIVSSEEIISDLPIKHIQEMDEGFVTHLIKSKPELIIIGHSTPGLFPPMRIISELSQQRIGIECMSIGAACRTYNVLLSEYRSVVAAFII